MNLHSSDGSVICKRPDGEETEQENGRVEGQQSKNSSIQGDGDDDETDIPFDKGWAWMICLSCFVIFYVYAGYDQAVSVLLVDIMRDLDTSVSVVSVMFSVSTCFYCLSTQLTNNLLLNHVTNRCLQTVAAVVNVLATILFVIHPNTTLFLVVAFIKAAAKGTSLISTMTMVGHYFKRRRALAVALGLIGGSVSSISVPPLTRYLRDEYGLNGCFLLIAGLEMHAVMATMVLRPINSYKKRKRQVPKKSNGVVTEEERRLLLSKTKEENNSFSPITVTETIESQTRDVLTSADDAQNSESRCDPIVRKGHNKDEGSPGVSVSQEDPGLNVKVLETTIQHGEDLFERKRSPMIIPVSFHSSMSGPGSCFPREVDPSNLLSDESGLKDQGKADSDEITFRIDNETPANVMLETQPLNDGSLEIIGDRGDYIEHNQQSAIEVMYTDTQIKGKQTLDIPKVDTKFLDMHIADKNSCSTLKRNLQSNNTNTLDIAGPVISVSSIHEIHTPDIQSPDTQMQDQDETKIIIVRKGCLDPSLTKSFTYRWTSVSSSIIGSDIDIQALADENVQTAKSIPKERESGKIWKMTSWIKVIINFSLLKNSLCITIFFIYCLTNGGILNMTYLPSHARHVGIASQDAAILMTVLGVCDMAARIMSGYLVDLKIVKVNIIMGVSILISGVVNQCLGLFLNFELLTFYVVIQGLVGSIGTSSNTILIVETLGIDSLSKVLPMCSLFLTVSIAIQQLIVGALIEYTRNYVVAFQYVGCMYLLSSILLLGLPVVRILQQKRDKKNILTS